MLPGESPPSQRDLPPGWRQCVPNDVLTVHGGAPLRGEIKVRGAKNLVSKAMVATLLGDTPSRLYDVPRVRDVEVVRGLLELHGVRVSDDGNGAFVFDPANVGTATADE